MDAKQLGPNEADLLELKAKHGKLNLFSHPEAGNPDSPFAGVAVVAKQISRVDYKRFRLATAEPGEKREAGTENLVRACVVWPDKAALEQQLLDFPALVDTWGGMILAAAGLSGSGEKKVL